MTATVEFFDDDFSDFSDWSKTNQVLKVVVIAEIFEKKLHIVDLQNQTHN